MTTEELRLEIQVMVKDALKNLTSTTDEVKRLAKEAAAATPKADALKATMASLERDLKTSAQAARLFGDEAGGLRERQAALKTAIVDLMNRGISPQTEQIKRLKAQYDEAAEAAKKIEEENRDMGGSFLDLQGAVQSIAAVKVFQTVATEVLDAGKAAISTAGRYEMLAANFETLTGSTAAAAAEFESLRRFANVTPFSLEGTAAAAKQLQAAKTPLTDLTTRLGQLGDLSLGNQQKFDSMVGAFSKMSVKGKVDLEQMNIFLEAGVPILDELASGYGTTSDAVFDMMTKGEVKTADFVAAMERMTSQGGQFFGGMARGAATWEGVWSTYKDSLDGVAASYGELLLPAAKAVVKILTSLNNAISDSPLLKGILAGVLVTATILLGVWAAKMAAATAATWLHYAATMALNAAKAIGNPILIAGIAAVGLATAGYVVYAASQNKAAAATEGATTATRTASSAIDAARDAASKYAATLDTMSLSDLRAAQAAIQAAAAHTLVSAVREQAAAKLEVLEKEITKRLGELNKKAQQFKDAWSKEFGKFTAEQSSDPFASIEYERGQKLAEAAAAGIGQANKKTIDEINAYYDAKRKDLADKISGDEKTRLAQLTASKVDDLELQKAAELAAWKGTEAGKAAIAADWDKRIAQAAVDEDKAASDARIAEAKRLAEETSKANAAYFDQANAQRAFDAKYSASKLDDLQLERDRELALFVGTEEQKATLAKYYAKQIADAQIEEARREFQEELKQAKEKGEWSKYLTSTAQEQAKDTEVGQMLGFGGAEAADPMAILIEAAIKFALSLESVQSLLNGISTMFGGVAKIVDPLLDSGLSELVDSLVEMGVSMGQIVAPFLGLFVIQLKIATGIINIVVVPILKVLGAVFSWLYDSVIVPFGNAVIDFLNLIIKAVNWLPNWLTGGDIAYISRLKTTSEIAAQEAEIADKLDAVNETISAVQEIFDEKKDALKDAYDSNISALKNLLELGAISEADYASRVATANASYATSLASLTAQEDAQLATLQSILDALNAGNDISKDALRSAGVAGYAGGAIEIPQTQPAIVHKGESIIPASFAEGLRRGDLTLSKSGSSATTINQVNITVEGSVTTEDGLVDSIATKMSRKLKRGQLETA